MVADRFFGRVITYKKEEASLLAGQTEWGSSLMRGAWGGVLCRRRRPRPLRTQAHACVGGCLGLC